MITVVVRDDYVVKHLDLLLLYESKNPVEVFWAARVVHHRLTGRRNIKDGLPTLGVQDKDVERFPILRQGERDRGSQ